MTAKEIENLLLTSSNISVSIYKEPTPLAKDTTILQTVYYEDSLIRQYSEINTYAFSNSYKEYEIGVYFTESGCPKTSLLNTALYSQVGSCPRGTRTHPTAVARILQSTAPEAHIYGFAQVNYPESPETYEPPLLIGSHS